MKTVGLISLGCPKNLVDSEVMLGLLEEAGYRIVQDPAQAEVLIVNTCAFIEDAKKEAVDTILEMGQYKMGVCHPKAVGRRIQRKQLSSRDPSTRPSPSSGLAQDDKPRGKCKKLIVTGCLPQRYKGELAKLLPEVDLFVGTGVQTDGDSAGMINSIGMELVRGNYMGWLLSAEASLYEFDPFSRSQEWLPNIGLILGHSL